MDDWSDDDDEETAVDVILQPPVDTGIVTDQDSDESDDEYTGNGTHLGRQLLNTQCHMVLRGRKNGKPLHNDTVSEEDSEEDSEEFQAPVQKKT